MENSFSKKNMKTVEDYLAQWDITIEIIVHDACGIGSMRVLLFVPKSVYSICRNHLSEYRMMEKASYNLTVNFIFSDRHANP